MLRQKQLEQTVIGIKECFRKQRIRKDVMKQKIQKHNHDAPEKLDLFRDTFRGKMPLTDDYVFHAVFGRDTAESKGALMEILNIILARKQDPIRAIVIKNPIETPEREMEKGTVMDIKAETDAGELLNIEMQANSFGFYQSRALFYGGRLVNSSLQGGEKYDKMRKSIVVSIIDGKLFPELELCHNIFAVREQNSGLLLSDRVEFHFLELEKIDVTKPVRSLTEVERLGAYLKYAGDEEYQDYVRQILSEEDMDMTENTYRKVSQDELEYERREARLKYQLQYNTEISVAREQGLAQGRSEGEAVGLKKGEAVGLKKGEAVGLKKGEAVGLKKGEAVGFKKGATQEKREIAKNLKALNLTKEQIAEATGLSAAEIEKL